ncbi:hypothetical protein EDB89DRAFT_2062488 [Lactarius sanguifluus]|nr:hypothetical protein EDB89DRAFT_2062488 [Lactarius sanguifluus]
MYNRHPDLEYEPLEPALMRAYIALARRCRPVVPPDVSSYIVDSYVRLRKQSKDVVQRDRSHTHTSARACFSEFYGLRRHPRGGAARGRGRGAATDGSEKGEPARRRVYIEDMARLPAPDEEGEGGPVDVLSMVDIRAYVVY